MDGPLDENIQNDPMQRCMVRPFERSRKNILTRRANHRHIFIVARIKQAQLQTQADPQGPLQQQPATGTGQPDPGAPAAGGVLSGLTEKNGTADSFVYKKFSTGTPPAGPQIAKGNVTITAHRRRQSHEFRWGLRAHADGLRSR
jgi:hypothetical protein